MFHDFLKQFYHSFVESFIDREHVLLEKTISLLHVYIFFKFKDDQEQILTFFDFSLLLQYLFSQIYGYPYYIHYQPFYIY